MKPRDLFSFLLAAGALGAGVYATFKGKGSSMSGSRLRGPTEARELQLFCENDGDLYRRQGTPILKNLITKMARGTYSHSGAVKLYGYYAESCAKKYVQEHGSPDQPWNKMFSVADRRAVAENFAKDFETEAAHGNYDHLLPKKYQRRRA